MMAVASQPSLIDASGQNTAGTVQDEIKQETVPTPIKKRVKKQIKKGATGDALNSPMPPEAGNSSVPSQTGGSYDSSSPAAAVASPRPQRGSLFSADARLPQVSQIRHVNDQHVNGAKAHGEDSLHGKMKFKAVCKDKVILTLGARHMPDALDFDKLWRKDEALFCLPDQPRKFSLACIIFSVSDINDVQQTFRVKYRLLCNVGITEGDFDSHLNLEDPTDWKPAWVPYIRAFNSCSDVKFEHQPGPYNELYTVQAAFGTSAKNKVWAAHFELNCETVFQVPFNVHRCPYDMQELSMTFQVENTRQNFNRARHWAEWHWEAPWTASRWAMTNMPQGDYVLDRNWIYLTRVPKGTCHMEMDQFKITMLGQRNWRFFFWRVMFVLFILNGICTAVFLFESFDEMLSFISTMLVADVAFLFVTNGMVPHVAYLTMLDYYVYGSFVYMCVVVLEVCALRLLEDRQVVDEEEAGSCRRWMGVINLSVLFIVNAVWTILSYRAFQAETGRFSEFMAADSVHERTRNASFSEINRLEDKPDTEKVPADSNKG